MQVFKTHRTALSKPILHAYVTFLHGQFEAAVAALTMEGSLSASDLANAALVTMIDTLLVRFLVIQRTHMAIVFGKSFVATLAAT